MFVFPKLLLWALGQLVSSPGTDSALVLVDRPIQFPEARTKAMLEYRRAHEEPSARDLRITPRVIVIHHTAIESLEASFRALNRPFLGPDRKRLAEAGAVNVSAHFLVDRDGSVFRLMPETQMARHTIGLNHIAIGVENVGGTESSPLTQAQLEANSALVRHLAGRYPITHLLGHHEYRRMEGHPYWRERDPGYRTQKQDPGEPFMRRLRARLRDTKLSPPP